MDKKVFFASVSDELFNGHMTKSQVSGMERILAAWTLWGTGLDNQLCYILSTSYHETGRRMQPVLETYAKDRKQAAARLQNAWKRGKLKWVKTPYWYKTNGHIWVGAGDVQLTHEYNYEGPLRDAVKDTFGVDIHDDPDLVLLPDISAFILIEGMMTRATLRGDFTGKSLEMYVNSQESDYSEARRTVNPGEKSSYKKLAGYAIKFENAMREALAANGETFNGPAPSMYDGSFSDQVLKVQKRLKELGYHEVGSPDGRWGTRTTGAVLTFRNDNNLSLQTIIDDELLAKLMSAEDRYIAPERKEATIEDLGNLGSTDMERADETSKIGWVAVGAPAVVAIEAIKENLGPVKEIMNFVEPFSGFIQDNAMILLAAAGAFMVWQAISARKNRLAKHQSGEYMSR